MKLTHRSAAGDVAFDWQEESYGTRSWFALLGPLLLALDEGAVLLVDELDASLHPRFAAEVVRLFHDPHANPKGAQLVFTSHDATVLTTPSGERLLDPAQVWLTEKDKDGATELYPLTDADPGEDEDLMQSYLAGAFGGVPSLLEGQIARRLLVARRPARTTRRRASGRGGARLMGRAQRGRDSWGVRPGGADSASARSYILHRGQGDRARVPRHPQGPGRPTADEVPVEMHIANRRADSERKPLDLVEQAVG